MSRFFSANKIVKAAAIFIAGIFFNSQMFSQDLKFDYMDVKSGVTCILEDNYGFVWLGTPDGLIKHNSVSYHVYRSHPEDSNALSGNFITALSLDSSGKIWIGTTTGLNLYFPVFDKVFSVFKKHSIDQTVVRDIYSEKHYVWFGTDDGLYRYSYSNNTLSKIILKGLDNLKINSIEKEGENTLLICSSNHGVIEFDKSKFTYKHFFPSRKEWKILSSLETNRTYLLNVTCLVRNAADSCYYIGTKGSFFKFYPGKDQYLIFLPEQMQHMSGKIMVTDATMFDNNLFVSSYLGLWTYDLENKRWWFQKESLDDKYALKTFELNCLMYSKSNDVLWIGANYGVYLYKPIKNNFNHFALVGKDSIGVTNLSVMGFCEDSLNRIWVATLGGIDVLDKSSKKLIHHFNTRENKLHTKILCTFKDRQNRIWFGSWGGGANYYDLNKNSFSFPIQADEGPKKHRIANNTVFAITQDNRGTIWMATYNGLSAYDETLQEVKNYFTLDGLSSNIILTLAFDQINHYLWIGTAGGVNVFHTDSQKFLTKPLPKLPLASQSVYVIHPLDSEQIMIGTAQGLFLHNHKTGQLYSYYVNDGLSNDFILGIAQETKDVVWLSTYNGGLIRFDFTEPDNPKIKNYSEAEGIQSDAFNQGSYFKSKDGEIYFGGENGFNAFYPDNIRHNRHIPNVYIQKIKVFEKELSTDSSFFHKNYYEISYKDRFLSIEFVAPEFNMPGKVFYSWRMEGLEDEWTQPTHRNFASYGNLPGGIYKFHVKAANNEGLWNESGTWIVIRVIPPFYQTKIFYASVFFLLLLGVYLYTYWRTQKVKEEKRILELKVAERTKELNEKQKDILASIEYAKRIQNAMLPSLDGFYELFPKSFIIYKPKDIVSGDFYWYYVNDGIKYAAAVDCTGHGVPGALMSMIGINILNKIVSDNHDLSPGDILNRLNDEIVLALKQEENTLKNVHTSDGMDVALVKIDEKNKVLSFAGAFRPLIYVFDQELFQLNPDKFSVGGQKISNHKKFTTKLLNILPGMRIFLFSDGYPDQFGGKDGKKLMMRKFKNLLLQSSQYSVKQQGEYLENFLNEWKKSFDQVDDILVIGIEL